MCPALLEMSIKSYRTLHSNLSDQQKKKKTVACRQRLGFWATSQCSGRRWYVLQQPVWATQSFTTCPAPSDKPGKQWICSTMAETKVIDGHLSVVGQGRAIISVLIKQRQMDLIFSHRVVASKLQSQESMLQSSKNTVVAEQVIARRKCQLGHHACRDRSVLTGFVRSLKTLPHMADKKKIKMVPKLNYSPFATYWTALLVQKQPGSLIMGHFTPSFILNNLTVSGNRKAR